MRDALAWDDGAYPEDRIRCIAQQLAGMRCAGELDALRDDTRRELAGLEIILMNIAGDVRLMRDEATPRPLGDVVSDFLARRRIGR